MGVEMLTRIELFNFPSVSDETSVAVDKEFSFKMARGSFKTSRNAESFKVISDVVFSDISIFDPGKLNM